MYKLNVDLHMIFEPFLDESSSAIVAHQRFELPFVPTSGLWLTPRADLEAIEWASFKLRGVTYDLDGRQFFAKAYDVIEAPLTEIITTVAARVVEGWALGPTITDPDDEVANASEKKYSIPDATDGDGGTEKGIARPRTAYGKVVFESLIRAMVEANAWDPIPFAMDQTGFYLTPKRLAVANDEIESTWRNAIDQHKKLSVSAITKWAAKVRNEYVPMRTLIENAQGFIEH